MAQVVGVLAHLHGTFWGRLPVKPGGTGQFGWLQSPSSDPANLLTPSVMKMSAKRLAGVDGDPGAHRPLHLGELRPRNVPSWTSRPHTVLHGDSHPGNTYFCDGHAGLLDWQVVRRGHLARDLAYAIVLGTPEHVRHAVERELLDTYRRARSPPRAARLDADDLWTRYRQAVVHPYRPR